MRKTRIRKFEYRIRNCGKFGTFLLFVFMVSLLSSCSVKKNLQDGQSLVKKNTIGLKAKSSKEKMLVSDLEGYVAPPKNKSFLNMNVWVYNQHETKFKQRLQKISDNPPSYFDEQRVAQSAKKMTTYLDNRGYFGSTVTYSHKTKKRNPKKTHVRYDVTLTLPYFINEVVYNIKNDGIRKIVMPYLQATPIKAGKQYDYYEMSTVRDEVVTLLRNNGYYMFNSDFIFYEVDSSFHNRTMKITFNIEPNHFFEGYDKNPFNELYDKKYIIRDISINPYYNTLRQNPDLHADTITLHRASYDNIRDTIQYHLVKPKVKSYIRRRALLPNIYIEPGDEYSMEKVQSARSNLTRLPALGEANITFDTIPRVQFSDTSENHWLHGNIMVGQGIKQSFSIDLEATTDNIGSLGTSVGVSWSNRNIFRGSEVLTVRLKGAMELQKTFGGADDQKTLGIFNTLDGGVQATLSFPRFLAPVSPYRFPRFFRPSTDINVGYNYQQRPDYSRNLLLGSFGYRWKPKQQITHNLTVLDLNLVKINKTTEFDSLILSYHSRRLYEQYSNHFIMAMNYTIAYSTQDIGSKKNFSYYRFSAESCGNLLYGINSLFHSPKSTDGINDYYTLLNIRYAQYMKGYFEFRRYQYLNTAKDHLAFRLFVGVGMPYGNALSLPFEKSFYGGGTNDLRGFQINSVGPGGYVTPPDLISYEKSGDIKLELNGEYRFTISGMLKGALFSDVGNVWLLKNDPEFENGNFKFSDFYKQLYWNAGLGIRFDIDILLIRLDLGLPLYNPGNDQEKWCIKNTKFSSIVFNFGIGYPF